MCIRDRAGTKRKGAKDDEAQVEKKGKPMISALKGALDNVKNLGEDKVCKGSAAYPDTHSILLFDEILPALEHQRSGNIMTTVAIFVRDLFQENGIPTAPTYKISVGRVKVAIPVIPEHLAEGVRKTLKEGCQQIVQELGQ